VVEIIAIVYVDRLDARGGLDHNGAGRVLGHRVHALTSDALEEWHCYSLPAFNERMTSRLRKHCEDRHHPWPAKGRYTRYMAEISRRTRKDSFAADVGSVRDHRAEGSPAAVGAG
jgi:hypothetical protein